MLLALTGYETALLAVALAFIVFALVVALVVPRSRPTFPGSRLGLFIAVCAVFFVAQMTAVIALAEYGEGEESAQEETAGEGATEPVETDTSGDTETTDTDPAEPEPTEPEPTQTEPAPGEGDVVAGKEVFLGSAGCASCHALADAGATGAVGPNLDATRPSYELVLDRVTNGQGGMPAFADTLTEQEIQDTAAYVSSVAGS